MQEIYYVKRVENSRLAPPAEPLPSRGYFSMAFYAALTLAAALFCAGQRFAIVQDGYRLETLQQEKQQIIEANRKLRLEVAALGDPVRIDAIARQELGMTNLSPHQIFPAEPSAAVVSAMAAHERPAAERLTSPAGTVAALVP
jgi:cell division protein FtsL